MSLIPLHKYVHEMNYAKIGYRSFNISLFSYGQNVKVITQTFNHHSPFKIKLYSHIYFIIYYYDFFVPSLKTIKSNCTETFCVVCGLGCKIKFWIRRYISLFSWGEQEYEIFFLFLNRGGNLGFYSFLTFT